MIYDFDYYPYRSSYYYSRPRYYTSYVPSYFLGDRYYNSYRYYRPLYDSYISPLSYARTRAYLPSYVPKYSYTTTPLDSLVSKVYPESVSRYTRASSLEPTYSTDLDYYSTRRAVSRARMMSEEPVSRSVVTTRYFYY